MLPPEIKNKKILVAALDWGMGHLTRTSVLIHQLLKQNNQIIFAGNEFQNDFIKREFSEIQLTFLRGYDVKLSGTKNTYWQLANQFIKLKRSIKNENKWLKDFLKANSVDLIISDNRYGFFSKNHHCVLLTHQLKLQLPFFKNVVNKRLNKWVSNFNEVWIPDNENKPICGDLVSETNLIPTSYIGFLSRFYFEQLNYEFDYLAIVSGPLPESKRFESLLFKLQSNSTKKIMIVTPFFDEKKKSEKVVMNPSADDLNNLLNRSEVVISRAGYTTIMDVMSLDKKAILIPTPGQYEQQYLASKVQQKNIQFMVESDFIKLVKQGLY